MKKRILHSVLSVFLALILVAGGAAGGWYWRGTTIEEEPIHFSSHYSPENTNILNTEKFLDKPDSIVYFKNTGAEARELSQEAVDAIYAGFDNSMKFFAYTSSYLTSFESFEGERLFEEWVDEYGAIEFRYNQRRNFTGKLNDIPLDWDVPEEEAEDRFLWGQLLFDAWLFIPCTSFCVAIPYLKGDYRPMLGARSGTANLYLILKLDYNMDVENNTGVYFWSEVAKYVPEMAG